MANGLLTAADILLRLGVDDSGVDAEVSSSLTRIERKAVASGDRISASVATNSSKIQALQLRAVAAQERFNTVLQREGATQGQIASSQASLITARRNLARETDRATASTARLEQKTTLLGSTAKGFVAGFGSFAAFSFLRGGIDEVSELQAGLAQSRAGIRSTGGVANVTAGQIQNLAGEMQNLTGTEDDAAVQAQNLLLTFTKVRNEAGAGNDIFTRAARATNDLAVRGFGTLDTSAKSLGKALNEPTRGVTALARAGITFDDSQRATIRSLVATGHILDAQKIILGEVERQVGGSAKAYGTTLPGELAKSRRALEDFEEGAVTTVAPALKALGQIGSFFRDHRTARDAALFAGGSVAALALVNKGVKLYGEISQNVFRRQGEKAAANLALAGSYDKVAVAATRAATAEGRESLAGAGGRVGLPSLGRLAFGNPVSAALTLVGVGAAVNAHRAIGQNDKRADALADEIATPAQLASARRRLATLRGLAEDQNITPNQALEANRLQGVIARAAPRIKAEATKAGKVAGQSFTEAFVASAAAQEFASRTLFSGGERATNIASARQTLADAVRARNDASKALADARSKGVGGEAASPQDLRIAQLRLDAARANLGGKNGSTASERASVLSAERTLNDLRNRGKATADQTAVSEGRVADAIRTQKDAQERVNEARKALDEARGISAQEALRRIRADVKSQTTLRDDVQSLIGKGATQGELSALKQLESEAPGTIHRIATTTSKKFQDDFGAAITASRRRTAAIERLFDGAETLAERRGRKIGEALTKGVAESLAGFDFRGFFDGTGIVGAPGGVFPSPGATRATRRGVDAKVRSAGFRAT